MNDERMQILKRVETGEISAEEAVRLLLDFAFNSRNMHRIWLRVAEYNRRAIRLYKRSGFVEEGRSRHDHYHKGKWQDALRMSILSSEWRSR